MPKKNRAYKKGKPHRDARLFVIVAEGEREDEYFSWFHEKNQRIKIRIVPREENRSAPEHFLERINQFIEEGGWTAKEDDQLWFVLDVDRWERSSIENLHIACQQTDNWHLGISNPCFEVWIHYHLTHEIPDNGESCSDLKQQLHNLIPRGYSIEKIGPLIEQASTNARAADLNESGHYPDRMKTKLYPLGEQMISLLGGNWLE